ncbi:hypothetical protein C1Y63_11645 [Corynebacterium sp. 13CS0277]|uniref:hypothetical protein n=1 Tax=Corynebacterium sp. 13CS0277 TaxID=2071994 RepID=UPI000D026CFD|nr:hypothetical protein [Corynebacterium sp. 13CS0277]PRQ10411.1 hypothetical protein C1Y63_11645 [Corynebacterium sp. 13CS0277]
MHDFRDPTRIPALLRLVERAWEAQPSARFVDILAQLERHGMTPAAADEDVMRAAEALLADYVDTIPVTAGRAQGAWMLRTTTHDCAVDATTIVVRPAGGARPSVWEYQRLVAKHVSGPLRVDDGHRFGIIDQIRPLGEQLHCPAVPALARAEIGDRMFVVDTAEARVVVGRQLEIYRQGRRHVEQDTLRWEVLPECPVGEDLVAHLPGGGRRRLGVVEQVWRLRR